MVGTDLFFSEEAETEKKQGTRFKLHMAAVWEQPEFVSSEFKNSQLCQELPG